MVKKNLFPLVSLNFFTKNRDNLKKIVLVGGAFDIVHIGHVNHLKKAKSMGDTLVVHITSDKRVREKKGPGRPIFSVRQRALLVSSIRFVDYVFIYNGRHYDPQVIKKIRPDIIFFNREAYSGEIGEEVKKIEGFNGRVVVSREKKMNSTTKIVETIKNGNGETPHLETNHDKENFKN
ncbi:MAG: adenylyltransferase/cytidyltransferase family protein [Candidatus Staskawiczbacteria bacterium]|nr:adenylyltransferase/cytidyltransferase family protein [Candidatus Staskawiczbacteria bacterium]